MFGLGAQEMFLLVIVGVLLFGKRLPEVGRSIGKSIAEFKSGLRGIEDEWRTSLHDVERTPTVPAAPPPRVPQRIAPTAPKFEEPAEPV